MHGTRHTYFLDKFMVQSCGSTFNNKIKVSSKKTWSMPLHVFLFIKPAKNKTSTEKLLYIELVGVNNILSQSMDKLCGQQALMITYLYCSLACFKCSRNVYINISMPTHIHALDKLLWQNDARDASNLISSCWKGSTTISYLFVSKSNKNEALTRKTSL